MKNAIDIAADLTELAQSIADDNWSVSPAEAAALLEGAGALLGSLSLEGAVSADLTGEDAT